MGCQRELSPAGLGRQPGEEQENEGPDKGQDRGSDKRAEKEAESAAASEKLSALPKTNPPEEADVRREEATSHNAVRELIERSQQTIEEWQKRMDDRVRHIIDTISPFASLEKEVARLHERLEAVEKKLGVKSEGRD